MDSIYKGYPFGSIILWRTREQLRSERRLGPFPLIDPEPQYPIDYVLDGQQRLTSIFGVFQTDVTPIEESEWTNIYFDFDAPQDSQDPQFAALLPSEVVKSQHFPINTFFDVPGWRRETKSLPDELAERIEEVRSVFQQSNIPTQYIETNDRSRVSIVFERVNRLGVRLDTFQLLSAWTWSEEFDLKRKFDELSEELAPFGFGEVGEDTNLLLRCCAAVVAHDSSPSALIDLNGSIVRDRFEEIVNGVQGAIDFLKRNLRVYKLASLPYSTFLVPLSVFFAVKDRKSFKYSDAQREVLLRWFWRSCFSRRYSAGTIRNLNQDITRAAELRNGTSTRLADVQASISEEFFETKRFTVGSVHTNTYILMLAQGGPRSFVSGSPIDLDKVLQNYNRNEFHHLYPQAYLRDQDFTNAEINKLANLAFMSSIDNKTLGGVAPSKYRHHMPKTSEAKILSSALCPSSLFEDDFNQFVKERSRVLATKARNLAAIDDSGNSL